MKEKLGSHSTPTFQFIKQVFVPNVLHSYIFFFSNAQELSKHIYIYIYIQSLERMSCKCSQLQSENSGRTEFSEKKLCWQSWGGGGGGGGEREQEQQFSTLSSYLFVLEQTTL